MSAGDVVRAGGRSEARRMWLERAAHLGVFWSVAVTVPLFRWVGQRPEFFDLRGSGAGDVVVFAVAVAVLAPLVLLGVEWLAALATPGLGRAAHLVFVGVLAAAAVLQAVEAAGTVVALGVGLGLGVAAALAYTRVRAVRTLLSVLAPAPFVAIALFLFASDATRVLFPDTAESVGGGSGAPVVLVIFDEFPVSSLMDAGGRVDAHLYPNFARLAGDATWYRNTASVDQDTPYAVPAILDGRLPRRERLPVAADHPQNIFSLLSGSYELHVREDATAICAPALCRSRASQGFGGDPGSLWHDLRLVYAHLLLPDDLEKRIPAVATGWRRLDEDSRRTAAVATTRAVRRETKEHRYRRLHANLGGGRPIRFERFVAHIEGGRRPRLHLIHILLPHVPFRYVGSGHDYRVAQDLEGLDGRPSFGIRFLVEQGYQRHLLQLQATDRLLGMLLDRLHRVGIYDRALVAVVADHGVSFRLGHDRRLVRAANVQDIAPVPFFLKRPGQRAGRVSDKPLRSVDVLPTIADVLGVRIPWSVDGRSALAPTVHAQRARRIISKRFRHTYRVDTPRYGRARAAALRRKLTLFGDDPETFGPRPDLLGRRVEAGNDAGPGDSVRLVAADRLEDVDPSMGVVPAHLMGTIRDGPPGGGRTVALALNGKIAATGLTFSLPGSEREQFSLIVAERLLNRGRNLARLFLIEGNRLTPLDPRSGGDTARPR